MSISSVCRYRDLETLFSFCSKPNLRSIGQKILLSSQKFTASEAWNLRSKLITYYSYQKRDIRLIRAIDYLINALDKLYPIPFLPTEIIEKIMDYADKKTTIEWLDALVFLKHSVDKSSYPFSLLTFTKKSYVVSLRTHLAARCLAKGWIPHLQSGKTSFQFKKQETPIRIARFMKWGDSRASRLDLTTMNPFITQLADEEKVDYLLSVICRLKKSKHLTSLVMPLINGLQENWPEKLPRALLSLTLKECLFESDDLDFLSDENIPFLPPSLTYLKATCVFNLSNIGIEKLPKTLLSLDLGCVTKITVAGLNKLPSHLTALSLNTSHSIPYEEVVWPKSIQSLSIRCNSQFLAVIPNSLKYLKIEYAPLISIPIAFSTSNIENLYFHLTNQLNSSFYNFLPRCLRKLNFSDTPLSDDVIEKLPRSLTWLKLQKNGLTKNCIPGLPANLTTLYFKNIISLKNVHLSLLPKNLTYLNLCDNELLTTSLKNYLSIQTKVIFNTTKADSTKCIDLKLSLKIMLIALAIIAVILINTVPNKKQFYYAYKDHEFIRYSPNGKII